MIRNRALMGAASAALLGLANGHAAPVGDFEDGLGGWWAWGNASQGGAAEASVRDGRAVIRVQGLAPAHAQFARAVAIRAQTTYAVSFDAWADVPRAASVLLREPGGGEDAYRSYAEAPVRLTASRERHTVLLTIPNLFAEGEGQAAQLMFHLGDGAPTRVHIDDVDVAVVGRGEDAPHAGLNLAGPGDFDADGQQGFFLYADHARTSGQFSVAGGALTADFASGGTQDWHVQALRNASLRADTAYTLRFSASADAARPVTVELLDADEYARYDAETITLSPGRADYAVALTTGAVRPGAGRLAFRLGGSDVPVSLDDVRLTAPGQTLANGDFEAGTDGWAAYHGAGTVTLTADAQNGGAGFEGRSLLVTPSGAAGRWWDAGLHAELNLAPDTRYEVRFATEGDAPRALQVQALDDGATWMNERVEVGANARRQAVAFETGTLSGQAKLFFFFGDQGTPFRLDSVEVARTGGTAPPPTTPDAPGGEPGSLVSPDALDARRYARADSLLSDQALMDRAVRAEYADWKAGYLKRPSQAYIDQHGGAEMLFVTGFDQNFVGRPEKGAVSEGVGYGLVITAIMRDRESFDRIWRFAETKLNRHGLMEWLYDDGGYTVDFAGGSGRVNATDGDLDAAYGLLVAAARWDDARYEAAARTLIGDILEHNVTDDGYMTSGDDGYDEGAQRATLNRPLVTSYMAPGYLRMFADFTGDARWDTVAEQGMAQLRANQAAVRARNGGRAEGGDGLITFRMLKSGAIDPASGGNIFHADAARTPWRVATDYAWYGTPEARDFLGDFNGFVRREGLGDLYESYDERGNRLGGWGGTQAGWMSGPMASSMLLSSDANERRTAWDEMMTSYDGGYYSASCRMLGILTAAGWYQNPVVPD